MNSVSLRYRKDRWMDKCKFGIGFVVSQMYGWMDERMASVSLRYSFCGKSDGRMDGWCKFEIVFVVSQMDG